MLRFTLFACTWALVVGGRATKGVERRASAPSQQSPHDISGFYGVNSGINGAVAVQKTPPRYQSSSHYSKAVPVLGSPYLSAAAPGFTIKASQQPSPYFLVNGEGNTSPGLSPYSPHTPSVQLPQNFISPQDKRVAQYSKLQRPGGSFNFIRGAGAPEIQQPSPADLKSSKFPLTLAPQSGGRFPSFQEGPSAAPSFQLSRGQQQQQQQDIFQALELPYRQSPQEGIYGYNPGVGVAQGQQIREFPASVESLGGGLFRNFEKTSGIGAGAPVLRSFPESPKSQGGNPRYPQAVGGGGAFPAGFPSQFPFQGGEGARAAPSYPFNPSQSPAFASAFGSPSQQEFPEFGAPQEEGGPEGLRFFGGSSGSSSSSSGATRQVGPAFQSPSIYSEDGARALQPQQQQQPFTFTPQSPFTSFPKEFGGRVLEDYRGGNSVRGFGEQAQGFIPQDI